MLELLLTTVAVFAGAIASVVGFAIGSLLTPVLALHVETKIAVAAVSIPHLAGTAVRFWRLRGHVDRQVLWGFGIASAVGGLTGALLHSWASSPWLSGLFGGLLMFVAVSEFTGLSGRMRFGGPLALIAGALSGLLGGLVGNQGGIRSAALMDTRMSKETFVATATAIGLIVDAARMPVYLVVERAALLQIWPLIVLATAGVVTGTLLGTSLLARIPESAFRRMVAVILAVLGAYMLIRAFSR
jgi:uncharacterized membrane protein YfcA